MILSLTHLGAARLYRVMMPSFESKRIVDI
jgi:hypothetical protein